MLEKASKSVWELILDPTGLGKDISETVERVFCRLSGTEPPLFPLPNGESQPNKESVHRNEKGKAKGKQKEQETENEKPNSSTKRKRVYIETSEDGGSDDVAK